MFLVEHNVLLKGIIDLGYEDKTYSNNNFNKGEYLPSLQTQIILNVK